jgi:hypothetical protein
MYGTILKTKKFSRIGRYESEVTDASSIALSVTKQNTKQSQSQEMELKAKTKTQQNHIESLIGNMACHACENGISVANEFIFYEEMDEIISYLKSIEPRNELFEQCWVAYLRKGSKKKALEQWKKLTDTDKQAVLTHIKAYVSCRERQYMKDFERYLRDKTFHDVVSKGNTIIYDPSITNTSSYTPQGKSIWFNEETQSFWSDDNFYYKVIEDGYNDDNRPDGATITLNNARGTIIWNSNNKKWEKK